MLNASSCQLSVFSSPRADQPNRLHEDIAIDREAVSTHFVDRVLRGVVEAVVWSVVNVDDVNRRHAALHERYMVVIHGLLLLKEVMLVAVFLRRLPHEFDE